MIGMDEVRDRMLDLRVVFLRGPLDDAAAAEAALRLMALDAAGDEHVSLFMDSAGGTLAAALALIDTIDLLGVPVHTVCLGRVEGPAVGVLAAGDQRMASPHARIRMGDQALSVEGRADEIAELARLHGEDAARFVARLVDGTGLPRQRIQADIAARRSFDVDEAILYGLVDRVWSRDGR
jgi:ATP-dependent Clp protease protease subunit